MPFVKEGLSLCIPPKIAVKTAIFLGNGKIGPGIFDDGTNLAFRMDDTVRGHDTGHVAFPKSGNGQRVKPPKCLFQGLPFFEDKIPTQSALQGLKHQEFKKGPIIMERNAPFLIMIGLHQRIDRTPSVTAHVALPKDSLRIVP